MATFTSKGWASGSTVQAFAGSLSPNGGVPGGAAVDTQIASISGEVTFDLTPGPYVATNGARAVSFTVEQPSSTGGGGFSGTPDDGSVTTLKIVDGAVTGPKIAAEAVDGTHIAPASITAAHVADDVATQAELDAVSNAAVGSALVYVAKTANFTVAAGDAGKSYLIDSAGAVTVTVPTDASDNIPVGSIFSFRRVGSGAVNFVEQTPATPLPVVHSGFEYRTIARQYDPVTLEKAGANLWYLSGNLA